MSSARIAIGVLMLLASSRCALAAAQVAAQSAPESGYRSDPPLPSPHPAPAALAEAESIWPESPLHRAVGNADASVAPTEPAPDGLPGDTLTGLNLPNPNYDE